MKKILLSCCGALLFSCAGNAQNRGNAMNPLYTFSSPIPHSYRMEAAHKGEVKRIEYESRDYTKANKPKIIKSAYVYLPYGYDETNAAVRYDVLFYMHGWTGVAGELFTNAGGFGRHLFDNMIERGDIKPMIIVSMTFDSENKSQDFLRSTEEIAVFHNDFANDLLPYIDSHFNTKADRAHRIFSGFSLGAVTTWYAFCYNPDLVKHFLPMSGDCWILGMYGGRYKSEETADRLEKIVNEKGLGRGDYTITCTVGTQDPIWDQVNNQMTAMLKRPVFSGGNVRCMIKENGFHDYNAVFEYLYNELVRLYREDMK